MKRQIASSLGNFQYSRYRQEAKRKQNITKMQINEGIVQPPSDHQNDRRGSWHKHKLWVKSQYQAQFQDLSDFLEHHVKLSSDVTSRIDKINLAFFLGWIDAGCRAR